MPTPACTCTISTKEVVALAVIGFCPLHKAAPALLEALEAVEWSGNKCLEDESFSICPSCDEEAYGRVLWESGIHSDDCQLQAAIKLAKAIGQ